MSGGRVRSMWKAWGSGSSLSFRPMSPVSEQKRNSSIGSIADSKDVEDAKLFATSGDRLVEQGKYNMAVYMYDEALKSTPHDITILMSRSLAHMLSDPPATELARKDIQDCLDADPMNWQAWQMLGDLFMRNDNFTEAEPAFRKAIANSTGMDKVRAQRSLADARSKFGTAISVGSSNSGVQRTNSIARRPIPSQPVIQSEEALSQAPVPVQPVTTETITTELENTSIRPEDQEPAPSQRLTRRESRIAREPTIQRSETFDSARQPQAQAIPLTSTDINDFTSPNEIPGDAPPEYSPRTAAPTEESEMSAEEMINRGNEFTEKITALAKGSLVLKGYTGKDSIDGIVVLLAGLPLEETLSAEPAIPAIHPSYGSMVVLKNEFPGNTFNEIDAEASPFYAAKLPGTIMVAGFDQEYREQQLRQKPHVNLLKQSEKSLPKIPLKAIMDRLQAIQTAKTPSELEDDEALKGFLGLSMVDCLSTGFRPGGTRVERIETICTMFTHTVYEEPDRFIDLAQTSPCGYIFSPDAPDNIRDFFYQMLIGVELVIRLRQEPVLAEYPGVVTDHLSTAMVMAINVIEGCQISQAEAKADDPPASPKYVFFPVNHQRQAEALLQFAETMSWPYLDEARDKIENAFLNIINNEPVPLLMLDWFFGIAAPGRVLRHRLMSCLALCSPSMAQLSIPKMWQDGVVVKDKSYWPQRTVLGAVFGALRSSKMVCGWVGPIVAPQGATTGYYFLRSRALDVPVAAKSDNFVTFLMPYFTDPLQLVLSLTNTDDYTSSEYPKKPIGSAMVGFKSWKLELLTGPSSGSESGKEYRPTLFFDIDGKEVSYTLYSKPMFVAAPPCREGPHVLHKKLAHFCLKNVTHVKDLKDISLPREELLVIYTSGDQEELLARAWCAERGKHAVIRRDDLVGKCCFACVTGITLQEIGLGTNVLIWSCSA